MKKKKLILDWEEDNNKDCILGIVSSSSHLQFVHCLNKGGYFNFVREEEIEINMVNEVNIFICFSSTDTENSNSYKLLKNKGIIGNLSKEFKGMDYILIGSSENADTLLTIKDMLEQEKVVQAVIEIEILKLSEKTKKLIRL